MTLVELAIEANIPIFEHRLHTMFFKSLSHLDGGTSVTDFELFESLRVASIAARFRFTLRAHGSNTESTNIIA